MYVCNTYRPKDGETSNVTDKHMCGFAVGIARALSYLSEQNYVHRDVAARNVLGMYVLYSV